MNTPISSMQSGDGAGQPTSKNAGRKTDAIIKSNRHVSLMCSRRRRAYYKPSEVGYGLNPAFLHLGVAAMMGNMSGEHCRSPRRR